MFLQNFISSRDIISCRSIQLKMSLIDSNHTYLPNLCTVLSGIPSKKILQLCIVTLPPFQIQLFKLYFNIEACRVLLECQMSFILTTFCIGLVWTLFCLVSINKPSRSLAVKCKVMKAIMTGPKLMSSRLSNQEEEQLEL